MVRACCLHGMAHAPGVARLALAQSKITVRRHLANILA